MRVINLGFFYIDDTYLSELKELFPTMQESTTKRKTYLPRISDSTVEEDVLRTVQAAILLASPKKGDAVLVSGTADVVAYVVNELRDREVDMFCPIGKYVDGNFHLQRLRRILIS